MRDKCRSKILLVTSITPISMFQILPYKMSLALILKILLLVIALNMFYKTQITSKNTCNIDLWWLKRWNRVVTRVNTSRLCIQLRYFAYVFCSRFSSLPVTPSVASRGNKNPKNWIYRNRASFASTAFIRTPLAFLATPYRPPPPHLTQRACCHQPPPSTQEQRHGQSFKVNYYFSNLTFNPSTPFRLKRIVGGSLSLSRPKSYLSFCCRV